MEAPDFWDDAEKASADMKELKDLKSIVERADALSMAYDHLNQRHNIVIRHAECIGTFNNTL